MKCRPSSGFKTGENCYYHYICETVTGAYCSKDHPPKKPEPKQPKCTKLVDAYAPCMYHRQCKSNNCYYSTAQASGTDCLNTKDGCVCKPVKDRINWTTKAGVTVKAKKTGYANGFPTNDAGNCASGMLTGEGQTLRPQDAKRLQKLLGANPQSAHPHRKLLRCCNIAEKTYLKNIASATKYYKAPTNYSRRRWNSSYGVRCADSGTGNKNVPKDYKYKQDRGPVNSFLLQAEQKLAVGVPACKRDGECRDGAYNGEYYGCDPHNVMLVEGDNWYC